MSWGKRRFITRTISKRRIKYAKKVFTISEQHQRYDGRLDGRRYMFALYYEADGNLSPFMALWGTPEQYHFYHHNEGQPPPYGPEFIDGGYPWYWWNQVEPLLKKSGDCI